MSDPFAKVQPGDPVKFNDIAWNAMLGAGLAHVGNRNLSSGPLTTTRTTTIVRVLNDTGANLDRCSVVGLNGPIWTPTDSQDAFLREPTFIGVTPVFADHFARFAVLMEPVPIDGVARAVVAGICPVLVDVVAASHVYADVVGAETGHLISGFGSAQILWKECDDGYYGYATGIQWALVRLGNAPSGAWGKLAAGETISGSSGTTLGSGTVTLCTRDGADLTEGTEDVTAYNAGGTVTAGSGGRVLKLGWTDGVWSLDVFPCS